MIVLVIILILAGAVIMVISGNDPVTKAAEAVFKSNLSRYIEEYNNLYIK